MRPRAAAPEAPATGAATVLIAAILIARIAAGPPGAAAASRGDGTDAVRLYAAASLREVLLEIGPECERATGARLIFNFGASSDLARQIVAAGRAEVFFAADEAWMDHVERAGLVQPGTRVSPFSNGLVVVVPRDSPLEVRGAGDLARPEVKRLALANPDAVPAGRYARTWLETTGVWDAVRRRVVPAIDVRAALATVESGAVEAGVVYRTDAALSPRVRIAFDVPAAEGPPISYALAALRSDRPARAARAVAAWLAGSGPAPDYRKFGFLVVREAP
jgi:molybdate transport system substrate-binding protein